MFLFLLFFPLLPFYSLFKLEERWPEPLICHQYFRPHPSFLACDFPCHSACFCADSSVFAPAVCLCKGGKASSRQYQSEQTQLEGKCCCSVANSIWYLPKARRNDFLIICCSGLCTLPFRSVNNGGLAVFGFQSSLDFIGSQGSPFAPLPSAGIRACN